VGGNVSLYNESPRARSTRPDRGRWSASCPTPRVGAVGLPGPGTRRADAGRALGPFRRRSRGRSSSGCADCFPSCRRSTSPRSRGARDSCASAVREGTSERARRLRRRPRGCVADVRVLGGSRRRHSTPLLAREENSTRDACCRRGPAA
jgi:hypothetical protein